jgi:hypothetical protein
VLGALAMLTVAGCAGRRITEGVYHSDKGYRVRIPGADWTVVDRSPADLELRHQNGAAGMLVNAVCGGGAAGRPAGLLTRQLLAGLRDRKIVERTEVVLDGRRGTRTVVEAPGPAAGPRFRIESVTVADARCVYDLIYAAPVEALDDHQAAFDRFLGSFTAE